MPLPPLTAQQVKELVTPAMNILWAIHVGVQDHPCFYAHMVSPGINNLTTLIHLAEEADNANKNP